jgi:serine/threonine-protein kinase
MRVGRYELLCELGSAGLGVVHAARLDGPGGFSHIVALRLLRGLSPASAAGAAFLERARRAAAVSHPNVLQIFEVGAHEGAIYVVTEIVCGVSLGEIGRALEARGERLGAGLAAWIVAQAANGLAAAARRDVTHGALSPGRILLSHDGRVIVTGFELVGLEPPGRSICVAPEVARGERPDARADVFALGVTLLQLLVGRRLFAPLHADIVRAYKSCPRIRDDLFGLAERCADPHHRIRYSSAERLADALRVRAGAGFQPLSEIAALVVRLFPGEVDALIACLRAAQK